MGGRAEQSTTEKVGSNPLEVMIEPTTEDGWHDKVDKYGSQLTTFLAEWWERQDTDSDSEDSYDHFTDLHISSGDMRTPDLVRKGEQFTTLNILYEERVPKKIWGRVGDSSDDFYFSNRALADFGTYVTAHPPDER